MDIEVGIPEKLMFLFDDARYKVAYGGRGSGKSWSFARAGLAKGATERKRILCAREVQKSIKQSVHTLLDDQIQNMNLGSRYGVFETEIRGVNGTEINFAGLSNMTIDSIKSYEGCDIVWVEEGQTVTKRSWDILIPTIRRPGSEIWVTFNPHLDTDDTFVRFVTNPPPNSIVRKVNYYDNPMFPDVLEQERIHCKVTDPDNYPNIWEGECLAAVEGAIYAKEVAKAVDEQRICRVPYDPRLKVHTVWDLGWNDSMAIILVQKVRSEARIIGYIEDSHKTLDWYAAELNKMNYNWGNDWLPHDGDYAEFRTGKSARQILQGFGRKVMITPKIGVEEGIKMARMAFSQCVFDKTKADRLIECLKRYRRNINARTEEPNKPLHDEFSHGADAFRGLGVVVDMLSNDDDTNVRVNHHDTWGNTVPGMGY